MQFKIQIVFWIIIDLFFGVGKEKKKDEERERDGQIKTERAAERVDKHCVRAKKDTKVKVETRRKTEREKGREIKIDINGTFYSGGNEGEPGNFSLALVNDPGSNLISLKFSLPVSRKQ